MDAITTIKLLITTTGISALIFLMLQVFLAQLITDTLIHAASDSLLSTIIFIFFIIGLVSALIATALVKNDIRVFSAAVFAFFITTIIITMIAYCAVINQYDILPNYSATSIVSEIILRGYLYIIAIPQVLTIFAVYTVNPWVFFALTIGMFNIIFGVLVGGIADK